MQKTHLKSKDTANARSESSDTTRSHVCANLLQVNHSLRCANNHKIHLDKHVLNTSMNGHVKFLCVTHAHGRLNDHIVCPLKHVLNASMHATMLRINARSCIKKRNSEYPRHKKNPQRMRMILISCVQTKKKRTLTRLECMTSSS